VYDRERAGFQTFRLGIAQNPGVKAQMEDAIARVYWTYDTRLRENRFTVGGVIEYIVGTAMRASGVPVRHRGILESDLDLRFDDGEGGYSLKAILKGSGTRLVNTMGTQATLDRWACATLFVVPPAGIVYADPALDWWVANKTKCLRAAHDAITVTRLCVEEFAERHEQHVLACLLPREADRDRRVYPARTHTADLAAQILLDYPLLHRELPNLRPGEAEIDS
jgi:hypothetical protein